MNTQITINVLHGSASVQEDDRERAKAAALAVLSAYEWRAGQPQVIDPAEAYAAYMRHMIDDDYICSPRDTILIAAWRAAEGAADRALTAGWHNPDGGACSIAV